MSDITASTDTAAGVTASTSAAKAESLGYILVVRHPFGDYSRGAEITDPATIEGILSGETACYVIKRAA
ncbi:hypothetical protein [Martelella alba]|uniref:Uncharacterized protein n=1 Tax=Martelella alba TaxID=2590451 RepID=A0ABY2SFA4_9HYPH|nr:hypothetical protein [Martelella alba]TKI03576.1 hypothetical protein FCN80_21090 [Martelella alba]